MSAEGGQRVPHEELGQVRSHMDKIYHTVFRLVGHIISGIATHLYPHHLTILSRDSDLWSTINKTAITIVARVS